MEYLLISIYLILGVIISLAILKTVVDSGVYSFLILLLLFID